MYKWPQRWSSQKFFPWLSKSSRFQLFVILVFPLPTSRCGVLFFFNILSNFSCCPNWKNWPVIQFCPNPWMCGYLLNHSFYVTDPATSLRQTQSKLMLYYTSFFQKPIENTNACAHTHTQKPHYIIATHQLKKVVVAMKSEFLSFE